jgi:hypothetical protein
MTPNGSTDPRREPDPDLLNAVEQAVEGGGRTGIPAVDRLAGTIPQADDAFRARLEDWLIANLRRQIESGNFSDQISEPETRSADMSQIMAREHHRSAYTQQGTPVYTLAAALLAVFLLIGVLISSSLRTGTPPFGAGVSQQGPTLTMTPTAVTLPRVRVEVYSPGVLEDEVIRVINVGDNRLDISGWSFELNGELVYTLPEARRIPESGSIQIYTRAGEDILTRLYMNRSTPLFRNANDEVVIRDRGGVIHARWQRDAAPAAQMTALIQQATLDAALMPTPTVSEFAMPPEPELRPVVIAVESIAEGTTIEAGMVALVYWPVDLAAELTSLTMDDVVGSIAEQDIVRWMPLWESSTVDD